DTDPFQPFNLAQLTQQLGQPDLSVQIHAVIGRILSDNDQLAHAVGSQLTSLAQHFFHRLGDVLAPPGGDSAEGTKPVAALGDFQIGVMAWRDAQAGGIFEGADWSWSEKTALFLALTQGTIHNLGDFFPPEDADNVIDLGHFLEKLVSLALGQAP